MRAPPLLLLALGCTAPAAAQPTGQVALAPCQNATSFEPSTSSQFWVGTLGHSSSLRGEGSCNDQPQPCSSTPGHTFCATDPTPHQCQRPPRKGGCPKCPHTLPASSVIRDPHEMHLPWSKAGTCVTCADTSQVCQSNCQSDGDCGFTVRPHYPCASNPLTPLQLAPDP